MKSAEKLCNQRKAEKSGKAEKAGKAEKSGRADKAGKIRRSEKEKETLFLARDNNYYVTKKEFGKLEEEQIAYWLSNSMFSAFDHKSLGDYAKPRQGMATSDNNRFLRLWYEVQWDKVCLGAKNEVEAEQSGAKWFPYNKGGGFRKWYGNND